MRPRVLVVDDFEDNLMLFVEELREANYDVTGTTNPNEALHLALVTRPAVVVTDISMPRMDGYELAQLLRSYSTTKDTRLIALSAYVFMSEQVPPGGWDACLRKPIEPGTLASAVRTVLSERTSEATRSGPVVIEAAEPPSSKTGSG
jgi:CheY-like chemotaxis protein